MTIANTKGTCWTSLIAIALTVFVSGCGQQEPPAARGFVLPAGNIEKGKTDFVRLGCRQCHIVAGTQLPEYAGVSSLQVEIGGKVLKVKDYGELMTSIVNPNHMISPQYIKLLNPDEEKRGASPMPNFNDTITVTELIDLVAFLHSTYETQHPDYKGHVIP